MARTDTLGHFLTDVADAIREKKRTSDTIQASDFDTEIKNLPSGGSTEKVEMKDANFYDYDGTLVKSYTKNEFAELTEMPENPTHSGLTSQGWNWSLANAKNYVNKYGFINIGQNYITNDGATRIHIHLSEGRTSPYFSVCVNGTAEINWGDGSDVETITGTSTDTRIDTLHNYSNPGYYVISVKPLDNSTIALTGAGSNSFSRIIWNKGTTMTASSNITYINTIEKVELGANVLLNSNPFKSCQRLKTITIPTGNVNLYFQECTSLKFVVCPIGVTDITNNAFEKCFSLKSVCLPNGITWLGQSAFNECQSIETMSIPEGIKFINTRLFSNNFLLGKVIIPEGITNNNVQNYAFSKNYNLQEIVFNGISGLKVQSSPFEYCNSLTKVVFNGTVTSFSGLCFNSCFGLKIIDLSKCTSIPTCTSTSFNNISTDYQIIVPDDLYESWIVASNWSTYADKIIKLSDYEAQ